MATGKPGDAAASTLAPVASGPAFPPPADERRQGTLKTLNFKLGTQALTAQAATDIYMNVMSDTYTIAQAQANLPRLCRSKKRFVIARRDKPVYVAMPIEDFDAVLETMELLANPKAMKALRAAR